MPPIALLHVACFSALFCGCGLTHWTTLRLQWYPTPPYDVVMRMRR
jgi:hypothetical protein